MKTCSKCKTEYPLSNFTKHKKRGVNGLRSYCKTCDKTYYLQNKDKILQSQLDRYNKDPDRIKAQKRKCYYNTLDNYKIYNKKNRAKLNKRSLLYRKLNNGKTNALTAKRHSNKLKRTPKWLTKFDYDYIKHIYIQAKELEKLDGIKRHVDHIIPLQGKNVSGLHLPWNLQILTAEDNIKKGNKLL